MGPSDPKFKVDELQWLIVCYFLLLPTQRIGQRPFRSVAFVLLMIKNINFYYLTLLGIFVNYFILLWSMTMVPTESHFRIKICPIFSWRCVRWTKVVIHVAAFHAVQDVVRRMLGGLWRTVSHKHKLPLFTPAHVVLIDQSLRSLASVIFQDQTPLLCITTKQFTIHKLIWRIWFTTAPRGQAIRATRMHA